MTWNYKNLKLNLLNCALGFAFCFFAIISTPAYYRMPRVSRKNNVFNVTPEKNTFTIVQFTDLHFGEKEENDLKSTLIMNEILHREMDTDLVVFSGDQISGWVIPNPKYSLQLWAASLSAVNASGIPFATIFGNHDDQAYNTGHMNQYHCTQWLLAVGLVLCLLLALKKKNIRSCNLAISGLCVLLVVFRPTVTMRESLLHFELANFPSLSRSWGGLETLYGLSNYVLHIPHSDQTALVFLLDTGGGRLEETFTDRQLEWVISTAGDHQNITAIAFAHIPPPEFRDALLDKERFDCVGFNHTEQVIPAAQENLSPMKSLSKAGVTAVFSGHDHRNSYCCIPRNAHVHQPAMCYGRHTGYGGYGNWMRGARVIQLDFSLGKPAIWTWLRMEDGQKREFTRLFPLNGV